MARYRIGNDMTVVWSIYDHTGAAYNLKGKEVRLYYTCERGRFEVDFEIQGTNKVVWSFLGREQKVIGDYTLSLEIIESASKRKIFKDYCNAFTLVGKSCEEAALGNPNISEDGNIVLSSKLDVYKIQPIIPTVGSNSNWFVDGTDTGKPSTGKSAYEYAKEKGYEGTESEYAESLKLAPENAEKLTELSKDIVSIKGVEYQASLTGSYPWYPTDGAALPTIIPSGSVVTNLSDAYTYLYSQDKSKSIALTAKGVSKTVDFDVYYLRLQKDGELHIKVDGELDKIPEQVEEKPLNLLCGILCGKNSDETGLAGVENYIDFSYRNNRYFMTIPADTLLFDENKTFYTIAEKKVIDLGTTGKRMVIFNKNNGELLVKDIAFVADDNYLILCLIHEVTGYQGAMMVSINSTYTINGFFNGAQSLANSLTNIVPSIAWQYGDISGGKITTSAKRLVSTNILHYDQDLVLKKNDAIFFYLWEYSDAEGTTPTSKGQVNKNEDYVIKAGTYFRLVIIDSNSSVIYVGNYRNTDLITKSRIYIKSELETICDFGAMHLNYLYNDNVKSIAHRGANRLAPENTIPAFAEAKKIGFNYIEADLAWSSDNVPVILHDTTIDRTSNGTGDVSSKTLAELKSLDFGSWYSSKFAGVQIPTFEELLIFCRGVGLKIYIELRTSTREQIAIAVRMAKKMGMIDNITWISVSEVVLGYVVEEYSKARVGIVTTSINSTTISNALSLKTEQNSVFIDSGSTTDAEIEMCIDAGLELESWDYWTEESIINLPPYITGITSDNLVAGKVLYKHYL